MLHIPPKKDHRDRRLSWLTRLSIGAAGIAIFSLLWTMWLHTILNTDGLEPHGYCFLWNPSLVTLHVASDSLIGLSYIVISVTLLYFVLSMKNDLPFPQVFLAFGAFIIACGWTHLLDVWTFWHAMYWLSGIVKLITALASLTTAVILPPLLPKVRAIIDTAKVSQERKKQVESAHQELEMLYEKTRDLDRLKTQFFANVSHELRTPLTLILGSLKSLISQGNSPTLQVMERNTLILLRHVNDLLDVARLEAGKMQLNFTQVDIVHLLQSCLSHFEKLAQERQITVSLDAPTILITQADPEKLQRVFLNLLSNAFKFIPHNGQISCSVRQEEQCCIINVQDNGPGIPLSARQKIFERFQQGEVNDARSFGGTGLGLAIAKDFVELQDGTITVTDAIGGGALFSISLPLVPATTNTYSKIATPESLDEITYQSYVKPLLESELVEPEKEEEQSWREQTAQPLVLVVEDNRDMLHFMTSTLKDRFRITAAHDGVEGLEKASRLKPDLIISDIMMPKLSGDQLVHHLRALPELDTTPIIILSARTDDALRIQLLSQGVQDYLIKPFLPEELLARSANLVAMKQARQILQEELADKNQDILALINEITIRKHQLEEHNVHLLQMNKLQDDFISVVSHEFRTTLTSIQGFSELLHEKEFSPAEVKEYATDINTDALRLHRMINELLDLERMKSKNTSLRIERIDLNALLNEVAQKTHSTTPQHPIQLHLDETLPSIEGDRDKLIQVLTNLLSNAIKYSPTDGEIVLSSCKEQDAVRISVQDHGIGIPQDELQHIFTPYSRVDSEKTRYIQGTGLGLSIVKEIIELHEGRVWAESKPGESSTFHFTLPLASSQKMNNSDQYDTIALR